MIQPFSDKHWLRSEGLFNYNIPPVLAAYPEERKPASSHLALESSGEPSFDLYSRLRDLFAAKEHKLSSPVTGRNATVLHLLFGARSDNETSSRALHIETTLPVLIAVSTWHKNISFFEDRLRLLRHTVVSDPSRSTFGLLMLLRKNISDLEQAMLHNSSRLNIGRRDFLADFETHIANQLGTYDEMYIALAQRARAVAVTLDHEVQMVIGAVTVQVNTIRFALPSHQELTDNRTPRGQSCLPSLPPFIYHSLWSPVCSV